MKPSPARAAADLADWLRFQQALGVKATGLSPEAIQALEKLVRADYGSEPGPVSPADQGGAPAAPPDPGKILAALAQAAAQCRECGLASGRNNVVFGEGSPSAELMFIGEGPGAEEDRTGRPFVGRAGELLTNIIEAMGLRRSEVYIANVVKCRPPGNRDPKPEEAQACRHWLEAQIAAISPRIIVSLGNVATKNLLGIATGITAARGNFHRLGKIPVMPTFHPSYLLRNYTRDARGKVWQDMQQVMKELGKAPSKP